MKAVLGAGVIFVLVLLLVLGNCVYVRQTVSEMTDLVASLPENPCEEAVQTLERIAHHLASHKNGLSLSISFLLLDRAKELTDITLVYAQENNASDYNANRKLLMDAMEDLQRLEKISWAAIM